MSKKLRIILLIVILSLFTGGLTCSLVTYFVNPLAKIYIDVSPTKTVYFENETLSLDGLEVIAKYKYYNIKKKIENYTISVNQLLSVDTDEVKVFYTEKGVSKTTSFSITVNPRIIENMDVLFMPIKTKYFVGEFFDIKGLKLQVDCEGEAKSFEPKNIQISKQNIPLALTDNEITIAYSERDLTVFVEILITVVEITTEEQEIQKVNSLLDFLPNIEDLTINDSDTIEYVMDLVDSLSPEQQEQIENSDVLQELSEKLEQLQEEYDFAQNIEYTITYASKTPSLDFDAGNPTIYKNADGVLQLQNPTSAILYEDGYIFSHWEDDKGYSVVNIQNISANKKIWAVFKLSSNISLSFINNEDGSPIDGELLVPRYNGTDYKYNLNSVAVNNFIFSQTECFPTAFYLDEEEVTTISFSTKRAVAIRVDIVSVQSIIEENIDEPQINSIKFVFGDNVREFDIEEGYLPEIVLSNIAVFYNEQNNNTLNYFIVNGVKKVFAELADINFNDEESDIVIVIQVENKFDITVTYTGGEKAFKNLTGKQTIENALVEYANEDAEILLLIEGLFANFDISQALVRNLTFDIPNRSEFTILLHNETEVLNLEVENHHTENYKLTEELPVPQKLGYLFTGWAKTANGDILTEEYLNIVIQNKNQDCNLYMVWETNPNYDFPQGVANYNNNDFVGEWSATFNHNGKILDVILTLNKNGVYYYTISSNNIINAHLIGEYRFENNEIVIYSVSVDEDYQLISKTDLKINLAYIDDNIIVVNCFYITYSGSISTVEIFEAVLNQGIKFANYYGESFLGVFSINYFNILTNVQESYIIELFSNGQAILTHKGLSQNALYSVGDKIILFSNGLLGVKDITEQIIETNRV